MKINNKFIKDDILRDILKDSTIDPQFFMCLCGKTIIYICGKYFKRYGNQKNSKRHCPQSF
jgi:hypothetical protein